MIASMSVFDLNGPTFLGVYIALFVLTLVWSLVRRKYANAKFSLPGAADSSLTDPYEIAYLTGGAPRCAQVAVVKLIQSGVVKWERTRFTKQSKLIAVAAAEPGFNEIERTLFTSVLGYGKKGMALDEVARLVATRLSGIESCLAKLGLRPSASEADGGGCLAALPLFALMVFGGVKVAVGISRDKPVIFLIILIVITCIVAAILAANTKKLTPAGEELLRRMRAGREAQGDALCSVALFGAAWSGDPSLAGLDDALRKDISNMGKSNGSSGCGGGTGCSSSSGCSSGCGGGGGCGGCGGCGGD